MKDEIKNSQVPEDEILLNKNRLNFVLDSFESALWELDLLTNKIYRSQKYDKIFGYSTPSDEWTFDIFLEHVVPEDRESVNSIYKEALSAITDWNYECRIKRKDACIRWIMVKGRHELSEDRKSNKIFGIIQDITEHKQADDEIKRHKYLLEQAQMLGKIGSWNLDVGKNELIWTDENYKIFGIPKGKPLTYEKFLSCIHPDDKEYVDKKWNAAMNGEPYDITHRLLMDDGSVKWVREKAYLKFDENRNYINGLGFSQDITERKQAEESQREVKETAESYLNVSAELIIRIDAQGTIRLMNDNGQRLLGYNSGELIGKNWFEACLPKEIRSDVRGVFHKLMNGDLANVTTHENAVITKTGDQRLLLWYNTLLKDKNGKINGLLSSAQDITDRKQAENELLETRERLQFALEGSQQGMWDWTIPSGEVIYNDQWAKMFGFKPEEVEPVLWFY